MSRKTEIYIHMGIDKITNTGPNQSFADVVMNGLSANEQITLEKLCDVKHDAQSHPIVLARSRSYDPSKPTVVLSAGIHGDEPAGVHAIIRFLNNDLHCYADRFNFLALPCLNPIGFDAGKHNTASGMNINDHFGKQSDGALVQTIEAKIKSVAPSVVLSFDLHEDNSGDQRGCYAYEMVSHDTNRIAHGVLEALDPADICQKPVIYDDASKNGVIERIVDGSQAALGSLDWYLKTQGAQHAITIETPSEWPLEKRIQAHLAMIHRGLEIISVSPTRTVIGKIAEDTAGKIAGINSSLLRPEVNAETRTQSFADSLRPTNFDVGNVNIWQLDSDPGILVRESKIGDNETLDTLEASVHEGETLFAEMRAKYGIRMVSMNSRREKNKEGKEAFFTLVDKIEGENLSKIESLPMEAKSELEELYLSLGQHYYDAWKSKYEAGGKCKQYWGDCRSDQFVYGNKYGESDKHFFIVDVDPQFYREGDDKFRTIEAALGSLCGELIENERKFRPRVRLQAARDKLLGIIDEILREEPGLQMIIEARTWLMDTNDQNQ